MAENDRLPLAEGRKLVRDLRALGDVVAPPSLLGAVLFGAGLGDVYWQMDSPIGRVYVAYNSRGISRVMRADSDDAFERAFQARFRRPVRVVEKPPARLARQVAELLRGGHEPRLGCDFRGLTEFERAVLLKTSEIPSGEARPYAWVAREIGHPGAVRAVGSALANNPVPLLIPCHRVVRSDGGAGGYIFGSDAKRVLLRGEGVETEELRRLARARVRYYGSDTTRIYCFPTCRNARRITESHRVAFGTAAEAAAAGYRPCRVCRPAVLS